MLPLRSIAEPMTVIRIYPCTEGLPLACGNQWPLGAILFSSEVIIYHLQTAILRRLAQWIALMIDCIYLSAAAMMNDTEILHKMHWLWLNSRHFNSTI